MDPSPLADVTVIIPAYRAADTIDRALASVAAQTLKPKATVVVDDGSPDNTYDRARGWQDRLPGTRLTVLRQVNSGPGAARNRALAEARTAWVAFLDADDEWLPGKLERSMAFANTGQYQLIAHDSVEVDGSQERRIECARRFEASAAPFVELYRRGFIDTATVVASTEAVREAGGFDVALPNAQDFDLWLAILSRPGARFVVFGDVLSRYHRTPGSVMSHIDRRRNCCLMIARRHVGALAHHPGSPFLSLVFRTVAVHREAIVAYRLKSDLRGILRTLFALAGTLPSICLWYLVRRPASAEQPHVAD